MYRHGDVIVRKVGDEIETGARVETDNGDTILAYGEVTGHAHRIKSKRAELYEFPTPVVGKRILRVREILADATQMSSDIDSLLAENSKRVVLQHEEHAPIELPAGTYEVRIQRQYERGAMTRLVQD